MNFCINEKQMDIMTKILCHEFINNIMSRFWQTHTHVNTKHLCISGSFQNTIQRAEARMDCWLYNPVTPSVNFCLLLLFLTTRNPSPPPFFFLFRSIFFLLFTIDGLRNQLILHIIPIQSFYHPVFVYCIRRTFQVLMLYFTNFRSAESLFC